MGDGNKYYYNRQCSYQNSKSLNNSQEKIIIDWNKDDLFSKKAEKIAGILANDYRKNESTQIRKFYDEFLRIRQLIRNKAMGQNKKMEEEYKLQLPYINMIMAKVNYSANKKPPTVNDKFVNFIEELVSQSNNGYKEFDKACFLFESVVAYFKK